LFSAALRHTDVLWAGQHTKCLTGFNQTNSMRILSILICFLLSPQVFGGEYSCTLGADTRVVRLDYPGVDHLCEVSVSANDGVREIKWYADNNSAFCSRKFTELVGKYKDLWGYNCTSLTTPLDLAALPDRYRKVIDGIVLDVTQEGKDASIPFTISATRVHATELEESRLSALVVQLFMQATDATITAPVDRTYFIEDDGEQFYTRSVWSGLRNQITLQDNNYRIDSAIIKNINAKGEITVDTTLYSSLDAADTAPCTGSQKLVASKDGALAPAGEHKFQCEP